MTNEKFLNRLAINLSLTLPFEEVENIIDDYDDWIENEIDTNNKNDIFSKLKISNIVYENKQNYQLSIFKRLSLFVSNPTLCILICFIALYSLQFFITNLVSSNILISTITTLLINFIFVAVCKNRTKNINHNYKYTNKKIHIISYIYLCVMIFIPLLIYKLQFIIIGEVFAYFFFLIGLSAFILTLYIILSNWLTLNKILSSIILLNGIISLTFYYIGQLHNMYVDTSDIIQFLICTTIIIIQIVSLSFFKVSIKSKTSTA